MYYWFAGVGPLAGNLYDFVDACARITASLLVSQTSNNSKWKPNSAVCAGQLQGRAKTCFPCSWKVQIVWAPLLMQRRANGLVAVSLYWPAIWCVNIIFTAGGCVPLFGACVWLTFRNFIMYIFSLESAFWLGLLFCHNCQFCSVLEAMNVSHRLCIIR